MNHSRTFTSSRNSHSRSIEDFIQWVQSMGLVDLPLIGRKYTWLRGRSHSRLDRGLVDVDWTLKFPELKLWALNKSVSDHCPLFLETHAKNWGSKPFRTIDAWFTHLEFIKMIKEEWGRLGGVPVTEKFRNLKRPIQV